MQDTRKKQMPHFKYFDYKDTVVLKRFLNPYGKILPKRHTGLTTRDQEKMELAVKRARFMGLLPYIVE